MAGDELSSTLGAGHEPPVRRQRTNPTPRNPANSWRQRSRLVLPSAYESAEIDDELHRQDRQLCFDRIQYTLRLVTDEPANRVALLKRNLMKYGTAASHDNT